MVHSNAWVLTVVAILSAGTGELLAQVKAADNVHWVPRGELSRYSMPDGTRHILGRLFPELADPAAKDRAR